MSFEPSLMVAGQDPSGIYLLSPWLMGLGAGAWFGWMAHRYQLDKIWWGAGGGVLALLLTVLAVGLGDATAVPYSDPKRLLHLAWALAAVAMVIGAAGGLVFLRLDWEHKRAGGSPIAPKPQP